MKAEDFRVVVHSPIPGVSGLRRRRTSSFSGSLGVAMYCLQENFTFLPPSRRQFDVAVTGSV